MSALSKDHPLVAFASSFGIELNDVEIYEDERTNDRSVRVREGSTLKTNSVAPRVPFSACVGTTGLRCGKNVCPLDDGAVGSSREFYTASDRLAATLAATRAENGTHEAYCVALPGRVETPTTEWTKAEIGELGFVRAIANCAKTKSRDDEVERRLLEKYGAESWAKHFAWARACVRSRAVGLEHGESFLAPVLDMVNHSHTAANVKWDPSDDGDAVVLRALRTIESGEELLTQYACEPAESFLLHMGFVGGMNPYDRVELWTSLEAAADWFAETFKSERGEVVLDKAAGRQVAMELEAQQRARERASIVGLAGGADVVADESAEIRLREVQSTLMGPSVGWKTDYDEALWLMFRHFTKALMPDENADHIVLHAIKKRCEEMLMSMRTTIEEDEKLFSAEDTPPRLRLAVEFRLYKKCLLVKHLQESS